MTRRRLLISRPIIPPNNTLGEEQIWDASTPELEAGAYQELFTWYKNFHDTSFLEEPLPIKQAPKHVKNCVCNRCLKLNKQNASIRQRILYADALEGDVVAIKELLNHLRGDKIHYKVVWSNPVPAVTAPAVRNGPCLERWVLPTGLCRFDYHGETTYQFFDTRDRQRLNLLCAEVGYDRAYTVHGVGPWEIKEHELNFCDSSKEHLKKALFKTPVTVKTAEYRVLFCCSECIRDSQRFVPGNGGF